jgi:hypothetical protein
VDGVAPIEKNIGNEAYPFTVDIYAATANPNAATLIVLLLSHPRSAAGGENRLRRCHVTKRLVGTHVFLQYTLDPFKRLIEAKNYSRIVL